ncbi:MAG: type II toxin-antitoxin system RelE/ParE family toxin [Caldimonas sp.]
MLRPKARVDRRHEVRYYREKAGQGTATRLVSALEAALVQLSREPGIGSPSMGQALEIDGLRSWRLRGFPISLWYFERDSHVEVVRLVGQRMEALWVDIETLERGKNES